MKVIDVLNEPWAIKPDKLLEIQKIYEAHFRGPKINIADVEARLGRQLDNAPAAYEVRDGVAIVGVEGVLSKKMNLFSEISGGASTQIIGQNFLKALNDSSVRSIVLDVDSPGGTVDGTQALADTVKSGRGVKPLAAVCTGMMASAAYWIGTAAEKIYAADATCQVGSIGVVAKHVDYSQAERAEGVTVTEITAGKYKRIASEHAPLTQEGRQSIQDSVDHVYRIFIGAVAENRGVSVDTVLEKMADGKVFHGDQAVKAGLVDGIKTLDQVVAEMAAQHRDTLLGGGRSIIREYGK